MNANTFYRHYEARSGHESYRPENTRERSASLKKGYDHHMTFRFLGYVVLLLWEDGVYV